jgi:hypothetical protein
VFVSVRVHVRMALLARAHFRVLQTSTGLPRSFTRLFDLMISSKFYSQCLDQCQTVSEPTPHPIAPRSTLLLAPPTSLR